jgi:hypothetical protein
MTGVRRRREGLVDIANAVTGWHNDTSPGLGHQLDAQALRHRVSPHLSLSLARTSQTRLWCVSKKRLPSVRSELRRWYPSSSLNSSPMSVN